MYVSEWCMIGNSQSAQLKIECKYCGRLQIIWLLTDTYSFSLLTGDAKSLVNSLNCCNSSLRSNSSLLSTIFNNASVAHAFSITYWYVFCSDAFRVVNACHSLEDINKHLSLLAWLAKKTSFQSSSSSISMFSRRSFFILNKNIRPYTSLR